MLPLQVSGLGAVDAAGAAALRVRARVIARAGTASLVVPIVPPLKICAGRARLASDVNNRVPPVTDVPPK